MEDIPSKAQHQSYVQHLQSYGLRDAECSFIIVLGAFHDQVKYQKRLSNSQVRIHFLHNCHHNPIPTPVSSEPSIKPRSTSQYRSCHQMPSQPLAEQGLPSHYFNILSGQHARKNAVIRIAPPSIMLMPMYGAPTCYEGNSQLSRFDEVCLRSFQVGARSICITMGRREARKERDRAKSR